MEKCCFVSGSIISLALLLTGCAVGPNYIRPETPEPQRWIEEENPVIKSESADLGQWWTVFNDPVLNTLIETAYQQNLSLRIAGIRILESRARLGIATGDLYPQMQGVGGSFTSQGISKNTANSQPGADFYYGNADLAFDAAWELDFWGKFRRGIEAGLGDLDASIANYDDILVTLTAEVARNYGLVRTLEQRLAIAKENVKIQESSLRIAEVRFDSGDVTELDVAQAKTLLGETQASIPSLEASLRQAKNALAILLGILPGDIDKMLGKPGTIPVVSAEVAVGVPAELLRRRPDIRLAERQLAGQSARIGIAKANLYPHFSLLGTIGLRASDAAITAAGFPGGSSFSDLWDSDSINYSFGPSIGWDIFNYGRIRNSVRVQDARFQELVANYENTVLKAAQEVEDAIVSFLRRKEAAKYLAYSVEGAKRSVHLSLIQYREGLVDYQRVLDAQQSQSKGQDSLASTTGNVMLDLVAVYKALGGGWQFRVGKDFVPEEIKQQMRNRTNWGDLLTPTKLETPPPDEVKPGWRSPDW